MRRIASAIRERIVSEKKERRGSVVALQRSGCGTVVREVGDGGMVWDVWIYEL